MAKARRAGTRKYGKTASKKVERAMGEMKRGTLRSGRSRKKVTKRKQAIAIGLSEARRAGGKVPARPRKKATKRATTPRTRKATPRRKTTTARKAATRKATRRKTRAMR